MRSAIIAAAFAATVIAVPLENRAVVTNTDVEMVYVTDVVTVTRQGAAPTQEANTQGQWGGNTHWWGGGHRHHKHKHTKQPQPTDTTTWAPAPSSEAPAPTSEAPTTTWAPAPSSEAPTKKSAAPAPSGGSPSGGSYQAMVVDQHNIHRSNHSASNIQWSDSLAATAKQIADSCVYAHNTAAGGGGYGQNIAAGVSGDSVDRVITNMFYDAEINWFDGLYGQSDPKTNFEHWGHFSQIVWKNTDTVGCYTKDCSGQGLQEVGSDVPPYFTVCNYGPPGNVAGQYGNNIGKPLGHPSVTI